MLINCFIDEIITCVFSFTKLANLKYRQPTNSGAKVRIQSRLTAKKVITRQNEGKLYTVHSYTCRQPVKHRPDICDNCNEFLLNQFIFIVFVPKWDLINFSVDSSSINSFKFNWATAIVTLISSFYSIYVWQMETS